MTRKEVSSMPTSEQSPRSPLDALLVHVMGAEEHEERPHLRGRSIVWAAVYLAWAREVPQLVFSGHHYWGETERQPLGLVTANEAVRELLLGNLHRDVTVLPAWSSRTVLGKEVQHPVVETSGEVMAFLSFARERKLQRLASVSSRTHLASIRQLYDHYRIPAEVISAEDVLLSLSATAQTRDYQAVIEQIHASEEEARFIASEKKKRVIYSIPFGIGISLLRRVAERRKVSTLPLEPTHFST